MCGEAVESTGVRNISGIYGILCLRTKEMYVGSAVSILGRWVRHLRDLKAGRHNLRLQVAWNKYGERAFVLVVLEQVRDLSALLDREQWWLDEYEPGYNVRGFAENSLGLGVEKPEVSVFMKKRWRDPLYASEMRKVLRGPRDYGSGGYWKNLSSESRARVLAALDKGRRSQWSDSRFRKQHSERTKAMRRCGARWVAE